MRQRRNRRRGIILLVVLVMLTLFAIAGLTFVLYADAASESARFNRDSETLNISNGPDMDPMTSLNLFLGQLIYGVDDTFAPGPGGLNSALRGHSLAETMYGSFNSLGAVPSDVPYNGAGRLHNAQAALAGMPDEYGLVNYMYFQSDAFVHDPARYGSRADPSQVFSAADPSTGGQNAPYTYPDLNSMFLATINQTTGQMTTPSYHRPATFNAATDWTSNIGKYKTCIMRPADMVPGSLPQFNQATGCSVKNLANAPGGADSPWIDIGAPELYTASGLRYKMLVAPLVIDLDSHINLNVVGNVFAEAQANCHAGNQGWGQWEVNMSRVLNPVASAKYPTAPTDWKNLFIHPSAPYGRYGASGLPADVFPLNGPVPHVYAQGDLNGVIDPPNPGQYTTGPTQQWLPPSGTNNFPNYPSVTYDNGGSAQVTRNSMGQPAHPMFFDPLFQPVGGANRLFPLYSQATLMYAGPTASINSDLVQLCPSSFNNFTTPAEAAGTLRRIYETTLLSMDLDRSGASPYFFDPNNANYTVAFNPNHAAGMSGYTYTTAAQSFPDIKTLRGVANPNSEFDPRTWRSKLPQFISRLNLDRSLATYASTGGAQPPDRQQFAQEIFNRLITVTGMTGPYNNGNPGAAMPAATPAQYATLRFLAQLSANIVDYIDTDDVMTVFQWAPTPVPPDTGYVFGTELPKLVVNEVYLEYDNDPGDPTLVPNPNPPPLTIQGAAKPYHMNIWAELANPMPDPTVAGADLNGPNNAVLVNGGTSVYQLVVTKPNLGLRNAANLVGDPDGATGASPPYAVQPYAPTGDSSLPGQVLAVINNWGTVQNVTPVGATPGPNDVAGYMLVGPPNPAAPQPAASRIDLAPNVTAANMTYKVANDVNGDRPVPPTILLQRLANPNVAFNAVTNPYVTVDYIDMKNIANPNAVTGQYVVVNDGRLYYSKGLNPTFEPSPNARHSYGRMEPYAAATNPTVAAGNQWKQQVAMPADPKQPTTTFFAVNNPAAAPANLWLVHLDRPLVSPAELAHVSGFKPHELTQQFIDLNGTPYSQYAPWTDAGGASLLYRLLEFVKVKNPTPGIVNGGRIPGRVNLNTIDPNAREVFEALCDAEPGNDFYDTSASATGDTKVDQVFNSLMAARATNGPFWGMAPGLAAGGDALGTTPRGVIQTLLASPAGGGGKYVVPTSQSGAHPYQQLELLNKLYNNTTTRSNTFAVWLTVGFFQITDDTVSPMRLGAEINFNQGKQIRHHMFAIVDRTQLETFETMTTGVAAGNSSINVPPTVTDSLYPGNRPGFTWSIQPGTTLVYDPGAYHINPNPGPNPDPAQSNEETVVVQPGGNAVFKYPHPPGTKVISRGHPGPWKQYNVTQDSQVVPYWVVLD
jgi:hypothetical protein